MSNDSLVQLLILLAGVIGIIVFVLIFVWFIIRSKEKRVEREKQDEEYEKTHVKKSQVIYTPESIIDFMDFDKIEDNMIISQNGEKYTAVIRCKGINYNLMSEVEQLSVEEGFIKFLNTLKYPIQLYVQAQNIDLKDNIKKYKENMKDIMTEYDDLTADYNMAVNSLESTDEEIEEVLS